MKAKTKGFTLLEMVLVIVIIGILSVALSAFIALPIRAYTQVVSRSELVDAAELALRRVERDIRRALPNSIRVKTSGTKKSLEMVNVVNAYRYRINPPGNDSLDTTLPDTDFNVLRQFEADVLAGGPYRVVINNTGDEVGEDSDQPLASRNIYAAAATPNVITPASGTTITLTNPLSDEGHVNINPAFQFTEDSPRQRMYLIDTPVAYVCDTGASPGNVTRYWNYTMQATQPINAGAAPLSSASSALLTRNITSCTFEYQAGSSERNAVVTIALTVSDGTEQVRLLHQVSIRNAP
jgi:MSHA biogenesis protein MshO